jgi:phosphoribosyl 1,2-cyclic phosphate phosphodiesterase
MKVTLLGTGTSSGVPVVGCRCEVCRSTDPRDHRWRSSAMIEEGGKRILIDCGPDFRSQMLAVPYARIDAVLVTHEHYDHVGGLDDLRPFCVFGSVNIYGEKLCIKHIRERMPYCFGADKYPSAPDLVLNEIEPYKSFRIGETRIVPVRVMHGRMPILGYRMGRFAYITDMKTLPEESLPYLQGVDTLVVNGLRHTPHPTHQSIEEAVEFVRRLGNPATYLTHLAHSAGLHARSTEFLPDNVHFAYDGEIINVPR